jgi:hypothetical protein
MRIILIYLLISFFIGFGLYRRQNQGHKLGGPISPAKALWLYWTVSVWFFIIPMLLYFWHWPPVIKQPLLFLTISMWVRGVIEIFMLFVSRNWIPPYGIGHNLFTLASMSLLFARNTESLRAVSFSSLVFLISMMISLLVESYYARSFFKLVQSKTMGEDGLWYAHEKDPIFKKILFLTKMWNLFFYGIIIFFLISLIE